MLLITAVAGNLADVGGAAPPAERIRIRREDMARSRLRASTDGGADVGLSLPPGTALRHGDLLDGGGGRRILVEQIPERIATARLRGRPGPEAPVLVGHIIGNRHRPISVGADGAVSFPIQADSELEVFGRLLSGVGGEGVDLSAGEAVFVPHGGADVRGHG